MTDRQLREGAPRSQAPPSSTRARPSVSKQPATGQRAPSSGATRQDRPRVNAAASRSSGAVRQPDTNQPDSNQPDSNQPDPSQLGPNQPSTRSANADLADAPVDRQAVASLVLAIIWAFGVGSVAAIYIGWSARREIAASGGKEGGDTLAVAGIALGWIGVGVAVLLLIESIAG